MRIVPVIVSGLGSTPVLVSTTATGRQTKVCGFQFTNSGTEMVYLKAYNSLAAPDPASAVPFAVYGLPGTLGANRDFGDKELVFPTGCWVRAVQGKGDTDTTAPSGDVVGTVELNPN